MLSYRTGLAVGAAAILAVGVLAQAAISAGAQTPPPAAPANAAAAVNAAVRDLGRTPWDFRRDAARKPADILNFSQIKPGMIVVDLVPNDGYYTRMLSKLVGPKGKVYALVINGDGGAPRSYHMQQREGKSPGVMPKDLAQQCIMGCYPTGRGAYLLPVDYVLAIQNIAEYSNVTVLWQDIGAYGGDFAIPEQVDAVFTVDGYHETHYKEGPQLPPAVLGRPYNRKTANMEAVNKAVFRAMKSGGIYLVADYAAPGAGFTKVDTLDRTDADAVKKEITSAGFVLEGESKILASASDAHTKPANGLSKDRDKMDQYVLRFRKPANAPDTSKRPTAAEEAAIMKMYYGNTFIGRADMTALDTRTGNRIRYHYYSPDHTYQEFGRVGEGPGPMQSGTWYWDADGHNCQLHQFPLDERANVVCHVDVQPNANFPFDVLSDGLYGGTPAKITFKHGHVVPEPAKGFE